MKKIVCLTFAAVLVLTAFNFSIILDDGLKIKQNELKAEFVIMPPGGGGGGDSWPGRKRNCPSIEDWYCNPYEKPYDCGANYHPDGCFG